MKIILILILTISTTFSFYNIDEYKMNELKKLTNIYRAQAVMFADSTRKLNIELERLKSKDVSKIEYKERCINGIMYLIFENGVTEKYDESGYVSRCDN